MIRTLEEAQQRAEHFGGHEFNYESTSDLFKCVYCRVYEVVAREDAPDGKPITTCPGLEKWNGVAERIYLRFQVPPDVHSSWNPVARKLAADMDASGVVLPVRFGSGVLRDSRTYVTTPEHVDQVRGILDSYRFEGVTDVVEVDVAEVDEAVIAGRDAYNAKYGASHGYIA